jgi:hypothetical protein
MGRINWVGVRNLVIILALAGLVLVSQNGFAAIAVSINQVITVLFVAGMGVFAYQYFRSNDLAWYIIPAWQRKAIILCGIAIAALIIVCFPLLSPRITALGVLALIAALILIVVWIVRESRRFR